MSVGTPFYCYSTATLERHYRVFSEAFAGEKALVCYAMKANSNQSVLRTLAKLGAGADVVSGGELKRALAAGFPASKILFSGVGKTEAELRAALAADILCINVESEYELDLLSRLAVEAGKTARISVRVNPDVDAGTHAKISTGKSENKFGIPIAHARAVYARAAKLPGLKISGVDMHIGSQITDLGRLETAYRILADFVHVLRADGHSISHIDFGGGLGIPYHQGSRGAARAGRLCRDGQARHAQSRLHADVRAGPADRRQCRHSGGACHPCEARRRQELRHHRCRDERSDPPDPVRGPSRHPAGAAGGCRCCDDHRRRGRPGLRVRRLSRARPHVACATGMATSSRS